MRAAGAGQAASAVKRARAFAAAALLAACNSGPLELAGADYPDAAVGSVANGVDPQIDPRLLPPSAPDHGIYLYWLFDSDSITVSVDASGHQRAGKFVNLPTLSDAAPTARTGDERGLFFNGTGQAVIYDMNGPLSTLSFGLWVKPACLGACRVFSLSNADVSPGLTLDINAQAKFELNAGAPQIAGGGAPAVATRAVGVTPIVNEHWYHVAGSVDASGQLRLFVNGTQDGSGAGATPSTAIRLMLGSDATHANGAPAGFRGVLDETIVYDWALPGADVASLAAGA